MNDFHSHHESNSLRDITSNKETLRKATEKFLDSLIDDLTLGIIFDVHRKYKTNRAYDELECDGSASINDMSHLPGDIYGHDALKQQNCDCPKCPRVVAATKFASHLETCMGLGRSSARLASQRISNNTGSSNGADSSGKERGEITNYSDLHNGDDDDDDDWSSSYKKPKKKKRKKNKSGSSKKKNLGTGSYTKWSF